MTPDAKKWRGWNTSNRPKCPACRSPDLVRVFAHMRRSSSFECLPELLVCRNCRTICRVLPIVIPAALMLEAPP